MHENTGDNQGWHTVSDEFYVRDVSGKEIAIYSGSSLVQWNIWGLDNVGKINADTTRNYYLKDHLGSIRVVLNSTNQVISPQDYDAWGYPLENRTYNKTAMRYDFTGKERDNQTTYDYFGARYYDSRIGRWGGVEPLLDKYISFSPYIYVFDNPILVVDVDGRGPGGDDIQPGQQIETVEPGGDMDDIGPKGRPFGNINFNYSVRSSANTNSRLSLRSSNNEAILSDPSTILTLRSTATTESTAPKLLSLENMQGLSLKDQGKVVSNFIGKNRVTMPQGTLDLKGAKHGLIDTPHFKPLIFHTYKGNFFPKTQAKLTRNATQEDLNNAVSFINKLVISRIIKTGY